MRERAMNEAWVSELAAICEPAIVEPVIAPLRDDVLAGAFFGPRHAAEAERSAAFPYLPAAGALAAWFGPADALRLAADPDACRAALDRDIVTLDALIADQLDAILHHPRL